MKLKNARFFLIRHGEKIMTLIATIIAVCSLWITWATLDEMRIDRENAYKPDVVFTQEVNPLETSAIVKKHSDIKLCVLENEKNSTYSLDAINIGVGVAKNIDIEFDENSFISLAKWLQENGYGENLDIAGDESSDCIYITQKIPGKQGYLETTMDHSQKIQYILSNAEERCAVKIPEAYIGLLHKTYYLNSGGPKLELKVSWEDIQGKEYKREYTFEVVDKNMSQSEHIALTMHAITIEKLKSFSEGEVFTGYEDCVYVIVREKNK